MKLKWSRDSKTLENEEMRAKVYTSGHERAFKYRIFSKKYHVIYNLWTTSLVYSVFPS